MNKNIIINNLMQNNNIIQTTITKLLDNLSKEETLSEIDKLAFKQLHAFCILPIDKLLELNSEELKTLYLKHGFGTIFSNDKLNNTSKNTYANFIEIYWCIQDLISFIKIQKIPIEYVSTKFKLHINSISKNRVKPYKTGILDFINSCKIEFTYDDTYNYQTKKMFAYFLNYDKDIAINHPFINSIQKSKPESKYKIHIDNYINKQHSVQTLLNILMTIDEYKNKIYELIGMYLFKFAQMSYDEYIKNCNLLFPNYITSIDEYIKKNIFPKTFEDVNVIECKYEDAKFITCESLQLSPKTLDLPGLWMCPPIVEANPIDENIPFFCKRNDKNNSKIGGYKKIKKTNKHTRTQTNKIDKTYKLINKYKLHCTKYKNKA